MSFVTITVGFEVLIKVYKLTASRVQMTIRFSELGLPDPRGWRGSHSKVYDYNTNAGSFYYQVSGWCWVGSVGSVVVVWL